MNRLFASTPQSTGKAVDKSGACLESGFTLVYPQLADSQGTGYASVESVQVFELKRVFVFTHGLTGYQ